MSIKQLMTPNGDRITGLLEVVTGNALVEGFTEIDGKLEPEYAGETKMWWDEQKPVSHVQDMSKMPWSNIPGYGTAYQCKTNGPFIYLDDEGNEWKREQLTIVDG